jgi:hypothetical protein
MGRARRYGRCNWCELGFGLNTLGLNSRPSMTEAMLGSGRYEQLVFGDCSGVVLATDADQKVTARSLKMVS